MSKERSIADWRERVGAQGFFKLVGAELVELEPKLCVLRLAKRPELTQLNGFFHGGAIAFLIDTAMTTAAATVAGDGKAVLTAEYKLNFLSPGAGAALVCRARVLKPGRRLVVTTADVFSETPDGEKLVATALGTTAVVDRLDGGRDRD